MRINHYESEQGRLRSARRFLWSYALGMVVGLVLLFLMN